MYLCIYFLGMHSCVCVYISVRAKVLTSIKYTITLYMYINMRNRGLFSGLWGGRGSLCRGWGERSRETRDRVLDVSLKSQSK